ncbi:unnamed protein product [Microthlaspi erraticum]|uniref:Uncharacterized protein n=1 Tax=Microthlaspi erraticum TaxID=1685480 RepID=A0A6D2JHT5_9BRAS|nr:unnamed protein product [Microthlaspi erraticum]
MEKFPNSQARYLKKICSDHSPLITSMMGENWRKWASFKFDQRWIKREGFRQVVEESWRNQRREPNRTMTEKISACRKEISLWKRRNKPASSIRIQKLHHEINQTLQQDKLNEGELQRLRKEINEEYRNEETFWKQKKQNGLAQDWR